MKQSNFCQYIKTAVVVTGICCACIFTSCNDTSTKNTNSTNFDTIHAFDSSNMRIDKGKLKIDTQKNSMGAPLGDQLPPPK